LARAPWGFAVNYGLSLDGAGSGAGHYTLLRSWLPRKQATQCHTHTHLCQFLEVLAVEWPWTRTHGREIARENAIECQSRCQKEGQNRCQML